MPSNKLFLSTTWCSTMKPLPVHIFTIGAHPDYSLRYPLLRDENLIQYSCFHESGIDCIEVIATLSQ